MHGYWSDIVSLWWAEFFDKARKGTFLITQTIAIALAFVVDYREIWDKLKYSRAVVVLPLAAIAFYALKRAFEDHYEELHKLYVKEGEERTKGRDQLARVTRDLEQIKAGANTKISVELQNLLDLQGKGINLGFKIRKGWTPIFSGEVTNWAKDVGSVLQKHFPDYLGQFFLRPPGVKPPRNGPPAQTDAINSMIDFQYQLGEIIKELRQRK